MNTILDIINRLIIADLNAASNLFGVALFKVHGHTDIFGDFIMDDVPVKTDITYNITFDPKLGLLSFGSVDLTNKFIDVFLDDIRSLVVDRLNSIVDDDARNLGITIRSLCDIA